MTEAVRERVGWNVAGLADKPWLAVAFLATTATVFALGSTFVRYAYDAGAGTLTIVLTRTAVASAFMGLVLGIERVPFALTPRERWAAPLIGVLMAAYSMAMYEAFRFMPVALCIVTFYTYPLFTGLFTWATGHERFTPLSLAALPLAFVGLLLALDVSGAAFNPVGAGWALLGSLGFTVVLILSARLFPRRSDTRPRTFVMLCSACLTALVAVLIAGEARFPATALGWTGLGVSSLCYSVGMAAIIAAASGLGAARVSIVMNAEPIASLILTFLILGETLGPLQVLGALAVVVAISLFRPSPRS